MAKTLYNTIAISILFTSCNVMCITTPLQSNHTPFSLTTPNYLFSGGGGVDGRWGQVGVRWYCD